MLLERVQAYDPPGQGQAEGQAIDQVWWCDSLTAGSETCRSQSQPFIMCAAGSLSMQSPVGAFQMWSLRSFSVLTPDSPLAMEACTSHRLATVSCIYILKCCRKHLILSTGASYEESRQSGKEGNPGASWPINLLSPPAIAQTSPAPDSEDWPLVTPTCLLIFLYSVLRGKQ